MPRTISGTRPAVARLMSSWLARNSWRTRIRYRAEWRRGGRACDLGREARQPAGLGPRTWLVMSEHAKHEAAQFVRFTGVERGEYRRGDLVQEHLGLAQHAAPGRGEDQDLPPPVALVTMTGDEPGFFSAAGEDTRVAVNEW